MRRGQNGDTSEQSTCLVIIKQKYKKDSKHAGFGKWVHVDVPNKY